MQGIGHVQVMLQGGQGLGSKGLDIGVAGFLAGIGKQLDGILVRGHADAGRVFGVKLLAFQAAQLVDLCLVPCAWRRAGR